MTDPSQNTVVVPGPAGFVALMPSLFGYYPDGGFILCGINPSTNEPRGMASTELPTDPSHWEALVRDSLEFLMGSTAAHGIRTQAVVAFICPDPSEPGYGAESRVTHQPITTYLREACAERQVHVLDSLYVTRTHWWSACCTKPECCPPEGKPIQDAAAEAFAAELGNHTPYVRRADVLADLAPASGADAIRYSDAIDRATIALHRKIRAEGNQTVVDDGKDLLADTIRSLAADTTPADLDDDRAAELLLLLQYRDVRDAGMQYIEPEEVGAARHLWRSLARFGVEPYGDYRGTPLALYGLTAWAEGETGVARIAAHAADAAEFGNSLAELLVGLINTEPDFEVTRRMLHAHRAGLHSAD
ncbi:DUF4192 domain-containing protein [Kitasatospora sp. NBC_01560]|uniref:DUF4192 domain-containing protein n=1 Tax=Kitasatospora sp. NBC_01560 TaxID=2975965 RepID=UPI003866C705